ncbi:hypothetical protein JL720_2437 [Aureococcus anophagefferens]|nr:hypothetical protein JL720_2437 [Aureococcus anophagefferens]
MRRARRSTSVYEVAKKCAVVRAEAAMDAGALRARPRRRRHDEQARAVMTADGKSVDRCLLTRPVEGWTSFKCLAASAQKPPPDPKAYATGGSAILAARPTAPSEPRVAAPAGRRGAPPSCWASGAAPRARRGPYGALGRPGLAAWARVPSPGEAAAARGALAAFLEAAPADRLVVHCLSNNGFSWLNAFCEDRGDLLATAAFVFDSAPHVPNWYVATYDAADVSTLEFATVPHIGGMRVRKDEYNRSVDALLARAFPASDGSEAITEAISAAS